MEQGKYATMLEEERGKSKAFRDANFGQMVGDGFPEMAMELADAVGQETLLKTMLAPLIGKKLIDEVTSLPEGVTPDWRRLVRENMTMFELPFGLFYWGVQVGRRLEREEAETLRRMEP